MPNTHHAEAFRQDGPDVRWGWHCLTCDTEEYVPTMAEAEAAAQAHMTEPATAALEAKIPYAVTTSRLVRFIPKIDSHGIMNMKGPKCVTTPTPAQQPVRRRSDVASMPWVFDDGGRAEAGFKGRAGDCVTRALTIANDEDYRVVYDELFHLARELRVKRRGGSPRDGVPRKVYDEWLRHRGWTWTPTMSIGSGTTVHLAASELPTGRLIVRLSRHLCAVIDGVVHDTHDPGRDGRRAVYGYWSHA